MDSVMRHFIPVILGLSLLTLIVGCVVIAVIHPEQASGCMRYAAAIFLLAAFGYGFFRLIQDS